MRKYNEDLMKERMGLQGEEVAPPVPLKKKTGESSLCVPNSLSGPLFLLPFPYLIVSSPSLSPPSLPSLSSLPPYPPPSLFLLSLPTPSPSHSLPLSLPLSLPVVMMYKELIQGYQFDDTLMQPLYISMAETGPPALPPKKRNKRKQVSYVFTQIM